MKFEDQILELERERRRERFKAELEAKLKKRREASAIVDLVSPVEDCGIVENVPVLEPPMCFHQIMDYQMKTYRNPELPQNVDMDSGLSGTMEASESSNWDNDDYDSNQYQISYTSNSPGSFSDVDPVFDKATLILICLNIKAIEEHLDYFKTVNSLILKRALESKERDEKDEVLDRDNYLYLRAVRGAVLHKMLGEKLDYKVRESLMSIVQNIDLILHPQLKVDFNTNEPFSYEEWSEIFIENHSDKKKDGCNLLRILDPFGLETKIARTEIPRVIEPIDFKLFDVRAWRFYEQVEIILDKKGN